MSYRRPAKFKRFSSTPSPLYHYTTANGADGIREIGHIKISVNQRHAVYGPGVYMTSLNPYNNTIDIVKNNYGPSDGRIRSVEWVVYVDTDQLDKTKLKLVDLPEPNNRNIYLYPDIIPVLTSDIHNRSELLDEFSKIEFVGQGPSIEKIPEPPMVIDYICEQPYYRLA
ncbi:uncharacterized protein LOC128952462 [Oppia nitens]|uniref:uncharacterized protein LOC128952462 n=1 Tax=Oppia nitens TaxID=1686743 RepID=UPI0023DAD13D|nr:uncharacterized protein LOC128952462 [Oppia nitens]